jgi:hypothetical protein
MTVEMEIQEAYIRGIVNELKATIDSQFHDRYDFSRVRGLEDAKSFLLEAMELDHLAK